ncbi:MAG TPA: vWA domain-containing protein, partial [Verrucomicrobiae bacterium]|nr:vWA domain-containing protein [Verrucomicrobiae bacterium]
MTFQFSNPIWLLALAPAVAWTVWLFWKSDVQIGAWRRWIAVILRLLVLLALCFAAAGLEWRKPQEGMTVYYMLDRSQSIPSPQQDAARAFINSASKDKKENDTAGVLVFGADAAIETRPNTQIDLRQVQAVVGAERTDIASAIRLGTAAFPETGQKRLVLMSDGNENVGDAMSALAAALPLGVSLDVVPLGTSRGNDVSVRKLTLPSTVKKGQTFDVKIFAQADQAQSATIRLYLNDGSLGEQKVQLNAGK